MPIAPALDGVWVSNSALPVTFRIRDDLTVELCTPVFNRLPLHLADATLERDPFDSYHLKVGTLDSALNAQVPLNLVSALDPVQRGVGTALQRAEYVLRFCRRSGDALECQSELGPQFRNWRRREGKAAAYSDCESAGSCVFTDLVSLTRLSSCLADAGVTDAGLPDCEAFAGVAPEPLARCLSSTFIAPLTAGAIDPSKLEPSCEALETLVTLGFDVPPPDETPAASLTSVVPTFGAVCEKLLLDATRTTLSPLDALKSDLCRTAMLLVPDAGLRAEGGDPAQLLPDAGNVFQLVGVLDTIAPACSVFARLKDFELTCCAGQLAERSGRRDGGSILTQADAGLRDAGADAGPVQTDAGSDAGSLDAGTPDSGFDGGCAVPSLCLGIQAGDHCSPPGTCRCGNGPACTGLSLCRDGGCG